MTALDLMPVSTYCLLMSGTPGPNNLMLTSSGAHFGYRSTLPQILGIVVGVAVQTALVCLGLGAVFTAYPLVQQALRVAGALYLVFLAVKLSRASVGEARAAPTPSFAQGALFQVVNPKSWVKAITMASLFMPPGLSPWAGALVLAAVGAVIALPSLSVWTLFGVAIRRWLSHPWAQRAFNLVMAASLLALAVSFLR